MLPFISKQSATCACLIISSYHFVMGLCDTVLAFNMLLVVLGILGFLLLTAVINMDTILLPIPFAKNAQDDEVVSEGSRRCRRRGVWIMTLGVFDFPLCCTSIGCFVYTRAIHHAKRNATCTVPN